MLMFEGVAEQAMNLGVSLFKGSEIRRLDRYGADGPGAQGSVHLAAWQLNPQ